LSHDLGKRINKALQEAFNGELMKALEHGANKAAKEIVALFSVRPPVVEYKEIQIERLAA
jgi:hypothetical protein